MNRLQLLLLICFSSCFNFNILAEEGLDDDIDTETVQIVNGQNPIELDEESQKNSGLQTQRFKPTLFQKEFTAYGKAVDIKPLLSILNQYLSVSAKQASAKVRLTIAKKSMLRLRLLHKDKAVSSQKLQLQQAQWQSDKAIYDEWVYQNKFIINNARLTWGKRITQWITERDSVEFDNLLTGKSTLLIVTLPAKIAPLNAIDTIFISPTGNRDKAFVANFISSLPGVDSFSQGLQYSFLTNTPFIQPGMKFTAWVPQQNTQVAGIIIPESALAWHLGQSFIFIKIDANHFVHKIINNPVKVASGYFISESLEEDEEVVVIGTQMLLSHEFRSQIPDEDDD